MRAPFIHLSILLALVISLAPQSASAELPPEQLKVANEVFFSVMSPFCPGRSLHDCPSGAANELKEEIRSSVSMGKSKDEILADLRSRFGDEISAVPSARGFNLIAWVAPIGFLLLVGLLGGFLVVRSGTRVAEPTTGPTVNPQMQKRIEEEVARANQED